MHTLEMSIKDLLERGVIQKESAQQYLHERMMQNG
jgi:twitching motility protein PilT